MDWLWQLIALAALLVALAAYERASNVSRAFRRLQNDTGEALKLIQESLKGVAENDPVAFFRLGVDREKRKENEGRVS